VHLDERSSAFFALGLAKATGNPVAVACTSGTAATNFFPAVVEAYMSRVPLVVLTADRPPDLRGVGANQTIDQLELYGKYVRSFVDAEVPALSPDALDAWVELAADTYARACSPGPVHVNLPFREPLVPTAEPVDLGEITVAFGGMEPSRGPLAAEDDVWSLARDVSGVEHGVVYAGGSRHGASAVAELTRALGWPLIAEPTSGLRVPGALSAGQFLLANDAFASAHVPDLLLQVGRAPTSRAGLAVVRNAKRLVIVDPDDLVADPNRHAERRIVADAEGLAAAVLERIDGRALGPWLEDWMRADASARRAVDDLIDSWDEPFEGRVARDLAATLPEGSVLAVGSSMPVRDLGAYMLPRKGLGVLANRGASGIDGFVSTVLGVAASGPRTYALMGDLTFLHDVGGLIWSARRDLDAVLVVVNNGGGAIFSFIEQRTLPELEELFTTPHGLDLRKVCEAAGAGQERVEHSGDLAPAVERAANAGGVRIVEVMVDRELNIARHAEVHAAVAAALA
jgi:2-succinyl-5-enolpyruvyl-6-hydroxy-3-cyclohexene-1-carboxylate synthase